MFRSMDINFKISRHYFPYRICQWFSVVVNNCQRMSFVSSVYECSKIYLLLHKNIFYDIRRIVWRVIYCSILLRYRKFRAIQIFWIAGMSAQVGRCPAKKPYKGVHKLYIIIQIMIKQTRTHIKWLEYFVSGIFFFVINIFLIGLCSILVTDPYLHIRNSNYQILHIEPY